jgi:hypothetical protein
LFIVTTIGSVSESVFQIRILPIYITRGLYIGNTSPPGGKYQPMSFGGKNMKRRREKGGKCKRERKKGESKRKKGERK